jgi:proline iminopeptidase
MDLSTLYQKFRRRVKNFTRRSQSHDEPWSGLVSVPGGTVRFWQYGNSDKIPLVLIHGGPGFPHNYLLPLKILAAERPVLFYDQLGCGASSCEAADTLWKVDRFTKELECVLAACRIERAHVLGHSWGTIVALECAFGSPKIRSLVLASPCISIPRWCADARDLQQQLPPPMPEILARAARNGDYSSPEAAAAEAEYYRRFVYGIHPYESLIHDGRAGFGRECYSFLWGPNELDPSGSLRTYDRSEMLGKLKVPVLYTCGRFDEATPASTAWYASRTPGSQVRVFELSAHMPHLNETTEYVRCLSEFLLQVEQGLDD